MQQVPSDDEKPRAPMVDVNFAPTNAFTEVFGKEEAAEQAARFREPTWQAGNPLLDRTPPVKKPVRYDADLGDARDALLAMGILFVGGAAIGLLIAWRLGYLDVRGD